MLAFFGIDKTTGKRASIVILLVIILLLNTPPSMAADKLPIVAVGSNHSLIIMPDGTVRATGLNYYGQLGDGTNENKNTPVQVQNLSDVIAVAAGNDHSLALKADGTVWAWGRNLKGQLGDGTTTDRSTPVQVQNLSDVIAIGGGIHFSVALKSDGTVWAWGWEYGGRLGNGKTENNIVSTPVQVSNLTDVVAIDAGASHILALKSDGTVWAWGSNNSGQFGIGTYSSTPQPTPVKTHFTEVVDISAGPNYSLVVKSDGSVWGSGSNQSSKLGQYADQSYYYEPVKATGPIAWGNVVTKYNGTNAVAVSASDNHSLILLADGTIEAWGDNNYLGISEYGGYRGVPENVSGEVIAFEASNGFSAAVTSDGNLWTWGRNTLGQLGDGTNENKRTPVQVMSGVSTGTGSPQLASIEVIPAQSDLLVGETLQLKVIAKYSDGNTEDVTAQATYQSRNEAIASVVSGGLVTAKSAGTTDITVSYGSQTVSVSLLVSAPVVIVEDLTINPAPMALMKGESQPFTVTARKSDGTIEDVTSKASFEVTNSSIVQVANATVKGISKGTTTMTVSYEGKTASTLITVQETLPDGSDGDSRSPGNIGSDEFVTVPSNRPESEEFSLVTPEPRSGLPSGLPRLISDPVITSPEVNRSRNMDSIMVAPVSRPFRNETIGRTAETRSRSYSYTVNIKTR